MTFLNIFYFALLLLFFSLINLCYFLFQQSQISMDIDLSVLEEIVQEGVTYMHACLFMLGAAYALKSGAHVRVDIFYRNFSPRTRAWVNSVGGIVFLMPLCAFIFFSSWNYVSESWIVRETSPEPGGIPAVFLLKSVIPLMALNLFLQGLAEILRNALVLVEEPTA